MSSAELKKEIQKLIPDASEHVLANALEILKNDHDRSDKATQRTKHISLILEEDENLLKRLAQ